MDQRIERIKNKLALVQQQRREQFGAEQHRYRLNAPLSEAEVSAFEAEHGIHLPADYRDFLRFIGNGGAGPYYGVLSLQDWAEAHADTPPDFLASSCPLPTLFSAEHELLRTVRASDKTDWRQGIDSYALDAYQGTITICSQGCTYYALLIVSGPAKGQVVYIDEDGQAPYLVENKDFLSWYERWLDETLAGYDLFWFGFGAPGTEAELVEVLREPATALQGRLQALAALRRLPGLSGATIALVIGFLADAEPDLQAEAAIITGKFGLGAAAETLRALLRDDQPKVRRAALDALLKLPDLDALPDARAMLRDPDPAVVMSAIYALAAAHAFTVADALALTQAENHELRRHALWALGEAGATEAQGLLTQMLSDTNSWVRVSAVQALRKLRLWQAVPDLAAMLASEPDRTVLANIIGALIDSGDTRAVPALIAATQHANAFVRLDAARALGALGDKRAIPALEALLDDTIKPEERHASGFTSSAYRVCDQATMALQKLSG